MFALSFFEGSMLYQCRGRRTYWFATGKKNQPVGWCFAQHGRARRCGSAAHEADQ
jgi:hypothetical protein